MDGWKHTGEMLIFINCNNSLWGWFLPTCILKTAALQLTSLCRRASPLSAVSIPIGGGSNGPWTASSEDGVEVALDCELLWRNIVNSMASSLLDATTLLESAELNNSSCWEQDKNLRAFSHVLALRITRSTHLEGQCFYLALLLLPALPQTSGQSLRWVCLALWLSEIFIEPVGPLAHRAHMKPQSVYKSEIIVVRLQRVCSCSSSSGDICFSKNNPSGSGVVHSAVQCTEVQ